MGLGALAAVAGLGGGWAIKKLNLESKTTAAAANAAAAVIGGVVGAFHESAGMMVAHNFVVAAGQYMLSNDASKAPYTQALRSGRIATPSRMLSAGRAMHGADELEGYEQLQQLNGVVMADNLGQPDVEGYEQLQGVVADNLGDPDVEGYEQLQGIIVADDLADPGYYDSELGDGEDFEGFDDDQDPFGDVDDE